MALTKMDERHLEKLAHVEERLLELASHGDDDIAIASKLGIRISEVGELWHHICRDLQIGSSGIDIDSRKNRAVEIWREHKNEPRVPVLAHRPSTKYRGPAFPEELISSRAAIFLKLPPTLRRNAKAYAAGGKRGMMADLKLAQSTAHNYIGQLAKLLKLKGIRKERQRLLQAIIERANEEVKVPEAAERVAPDDVRDARARESVHEQAAAEEWWDTKVSIADPAHTVVGMDIVDLHFENKQQMEVEITKRREGGYRLEDITVYRLGPQKLVQMIFLKRS